ncbi:FAD:protein FMN transferase [Betaproteobacteria bacterium]|nr:FAD:protein FMN transferase [Betaproteobacteria bacterium]GHU42615.1 FAD:protein FMN transferase [Betaproteobacteria bacterium]
MRRVAWRSVFCFLPAALCLLASGCSKPVVTQESYVFGTRVEILVADAPENSANAVAAAVLRDFDKLHRKYHAWQPSELTAVNDAIAAGKSVEVSEELASLITEVQNLAQQSRYRFDPGIGKLIQLWGFQSDEFTPQLPDPADLAKWRAHPASIMQLHLAGRTVTSANRDVALDFGGYLKGVALDRAAASLKAAGINNAIINIGGNVMALGDKYGKPWKIGIQHPRRPGTLATLELRDGEAIGTSGDYQRYFDLDGKRYSHLLDPLRGEPVQHTQAVTLLIPPARDAGGRSDALSKPVFIAGAKGWQEAARELGLKQALRIDADGNIEVTSALNQRLVFVDKTLNIRVVD